MKISSKTKMSKAWIFFTLAAVFYLIAVLGYYHYQTSPTSTDFIFQTSAVPNEIKPKPLTWPSYGQSAVASVDYGVIETHGSSKPQSTASSAKLITALAVMKKKPFSDGEGEKIKFNHEDVLSYEKYLAGNGSVVPVSDGLEWSQYQAIQAVLLASANNVSDKLAIWAFGSVDSYREYAQKMVEDLGMKDTEIGVDASGYDYSTTSTAHDLAILALEIIKQPTLKEIINQSSADLPMAGTIKNTNRLLEAKDDVNGMKTGYINESGGVFVLSGKIKIGEYEQDVASVVMGAPGNIVQASEVAQTDAYKLFSSMKNNFILKKVITKNQKMSDIEVPWSGVKYPVYAKEDISTLVWAGREVYVSTIIYPLSFDSIGDAGKVTVRNGSAVYTSGLELKGKISTPTLIWRLTH